MDLFPPLELPFREPVAVFTTVLMLLLFAPFLFRKLRVPGIIGLILSGMLIGPHGLGLLERDASIELFSTIGLLYILFLAGLELDQKEFVKYRNASIGFGLLSFALPFAFGFGLALFYLHSTTPVAVLIGLTLASHTLVAYPIVSRLGLHTLPAVLVSVGGTIIADSLVLVLLAVLQASIAGDSGWAFWGLFALKLSAFLSVVFFLLPRMARWFFRALEDERSAQFVFVLTALFGSGWLAEIAGLEPIIGAFMCGLALNPLIPFRSALMDRIDFAGHALFIPFFLLSVGMLVDPRVFISGWQAWALLGLLSLAALLGKFLAAWITQLGFGFTAEERRLMFGLSAARAAATIAVVMVGYRLDIVGLPLVNATVALILITSLISSLVTDRASRKLAARERNRPAMAAQLTSDRILVPIANPQNYMRLLDLAVGIRHTQSDCPIMAVRIVADAQANDLTAKSETAKNAGLLTEAGEYLRSNKVPFETFVRVDYNVASGIVHTATERFASDLVLGWNERTGAAELLYGTVLQQVLRRSTLNCWVFRQLHPLHTNEDIGVVLPPLSGLESGFARCVEQLQHLAKHLSSRLHVYGEPQELSDFMRVLPESERDSVHLVECALDDVLAALEPDMDINDLIVVVSAREGTLSYAAKNALLPASLTEKYPANNLVLLYPEQAEGREGASEVIRLPRLPNLRIVRSLILPRSDERASG
ncbi:cation:proton antiporter [bacterium]|nr:cation:proton antiporter [bacterium]